MSFDGEMPHRFPDGAPDEVLAWRCQECGEWISELGRDESKCSIDWRAAVPSEPTTPTDARCRECGALLGEHQAYPDPISGGWDGYQAACYDCDWRAETVHPSGREGKNAARVEAAAHIRETLARGEVGPSPEQIEVVARILHQFECWDSSRTYEDCAREILLAVWSVNDAEETSL